MTRSAYVLRIVEAGLPAWRLRERRAALSAKTPEPARGLSRREALAVVGFAAGGVATVGAEDVADARVAGYPRVRVVELQALRVNRPHAFDYPLKGQGNVLIDFGHRVPRGVGPQRSIVAYSTACQHMGCGVAYNRRLRQLVCPCHQTRYDPERLGAIIEGVATRALPRVLLRVRNGAVFAVGLDGLVYGYRSNLRPGRKVGTR
jgi:arsenite oxidase small subunit